jgi:hypothetical protein
MNPYLRHLKILPGPWHPKEVGMNPQSYTVCDYEGREIIRLEAGQGEVERCRNTAQLVAHAPQLLAAVIEYAHEQHTNRQLTPELAELILGAGGPDLTQLAVKQPAVQKPKRWSNELQRSIDAEEDT